MGGGDPFPHPPLARPVTGRGSQALGCWDPNLGPPQLFSSGCAPVTPVTHLSVCLLVRGITKQVSKVIWQKAASTSCHPSRLRMDSSDLDPRLIHGSWDRRDSVPKRHLDRSGRFAHHTGVSNTDRQKYRSRYVRHL